VTAPGLVEPLLPGLSVVVATHGRPAAAARLVAELLAQQDLAHPWELLVVNDHGDPSVYAAIAAVPNPRGVPVRAFDTGYAGYGVVLARNAGLRFARHEAIVFLDDDLSVEPRFLSAYERAPQGLRIGRVDFAVVRDGVRRVYPDRRGELVAGATRVIEDPRPYLGFAWGANCSVPTRLALVLGGFDEAFLDEGEEDMDFGARAMLAARGLVCVPEARAVHDGPDRTLAAELGVDLGPPRIGRAQERFASRGGLVVNGGPSYWSLPKWDAMPVRLG
jgi:glycosyltransferase involved in cell wall biosynthesis